LLISRMRKQPFSVILLDEFEKSHAQTYGTDRSVTHSELVKHASQLGY